MYQQFLDGQGEYENEEEVDAAEINWGKDPTLVN